ncbi:transporter substrate-binding domain-containing protein [Geminicoccaceae bacterium 1502E]|nr:transporter substrate-binding domain-containing protein [Geminicoccaceae bacterium 1502E]
MRMKESLTALAGAVCVVAAAGAAEAACTLKTAVDGTFAPHAMPTLDGKTEGFNIDLAQEIGKRLGCEVTVTSAQYSGLLPAMQAGTYDFIAAPTTVTEERAGQMLFTEGYLNTDYQFLTKKGAPEVKSLEELKGKTISVNKGSAYDAWARKMAEQVGWEVESYGTNTDAVQAVLSGRAFANVAGQTVIQYAAKRNPQLQLSYYHSTGLVWSMPFPKGSEELRNKVENALECMKKDGTIAAMSEQWFGVTPKEGDAAVTVYPGYGVPGMPGYDDTAHEPSCG